MSKKIIRLAIIRNDESDPCPYGLKVPSACKIAGDTVDRMSSVLLLKDDDKEQKDSIISANNKILRWASQGQRCKYADKLFDQSPTVECNYGDTAPEQKQTSALLGSPFYSKHFSGIGLDGLYSYPTGFYADNNTSRNTYYGISSLQGFEDNGDLVKIAEELVGLIIKNK